MSQTITLNWTQDDAKTTRHEILVSIDGGAENSLGFFDIDVLTTTYEAAEGHEFTFYADPYSVDVKGTRATINSVIIPELIKKFIDAELSDAGDWTNEPDTVSHYAAGDGNGTATYTFNLNNLSGWSSGNSVDIYVKHANVDGTESSVTAIIVDEFAQEVALIVEAISQSRIDLTWDAYSGEDGVSVERSNDGASGWAEIYDSGVAGETTYSDTGLSADVERYYRMRAYTGAAYTNYTNTVSATTYAAGYADVTGKTGTTPGLEA